MTFESSQKRQGQVRFATRKLDVSMAIKHVSLVILTVQNSALILTMRYSRIIQGPRYLPTTAVLLSECLKSVLSFIILLISSRRGGTNRTDNEVEAGGLPTIPPSKAERQTITLILRDVFSVQSGIVSILLPAILYTIQNNLQYQAATNLDAATFQTTYQGKILATAFFAVLILRQKLTYTKWLAIVILTAGVILISYPSNMLVKSKHDTEQGPNRSIGLTAVGAACLTSGLAGVYLEHILKKVKDNRTPNGMSMLWTRNVQLCLASVLIAAVATAVVDGPKILRDGFFYGYNSVVCATVLLQAGGGLVVALVIIYADNILKNFATTMSTVISAGFSVMSGDCIMTRQLAGGIVLVLVATNLYGAGSCFGRASSTELPAKEKSEKAKRPDVDAANQEAVRLLDNRRHEEP